MISREPAENSKKKFDLVVVGGGIYGAMLLLEASRCGLSCLLVERDDFGEHTSYNSLRILHGGLRYLQKLDLHRFHESVDERSWFLRTFPQYAMPLACLMPLYGNGLRRPAIFSIALWLNDFLSRNRNEQVQEDRHLLRGQVVSAGRTRELFPDVDPEGLKGGAIWYDACMPDSQSLLIAILRWACSLGACALNYVKATDLLSEHGKVVGIQAVDCENGQQYEYQAKYVVNAAGPWCREVASKFDRDNPELFQYSIAWNILFDRKALSDHALAVAPKKQGAHTYFLFPWKDMLFAGTGHVPWTGGIERPMPTDEMLNKFIADLNMAIPGLNVDRSAILRVFSGLLPSREKGTSDLAVREVIFDHSSQGGPEGLFSVSGVKFTTSRLVAEKTIHQLFPDRRIPDHDVLGQPSVISPKRGLYDFNWLPSSNDSSWLKELKAIIAEESVLHLDDLVIRRTSLADNPQRILAIAPAICSLFDWDESRIKEEVQRVRAKLGMVEGEHSTC